QLVLHERVEGADGALDGAGEVVEVGLRAYGGGSRGGSRGRRGREDRRLHGMRLKLVGQVHEEAVDLLGVVTGGGERERGGTGARQVDHLRSPPRGARKQTETRGSIPLSGDGGNCFSAQLRLTAP